MLIARQQGSPLLGAINYVIRRSALPLLGATIIAILAFAPIGLSQDSTGEYCKSLFQVLLISLMLSWFSALTITPVLIKWWLFKNAPSAAAAEEKADPYRGSFYRGYQQALRILLQQKTLTLVLMGALLAGAIWGFTFVRQNFFPSSNTPIFFVDLWLPYGTDINATEKMTRDIERSIAGQPGWPPPSPPSARAVCVSFSPTAGSASTATTRRLWCGWMINAASPLSPATWRTGLPETTRRLTPAPNALCSGPPGIARLRCALGPDPDTLRALASQVGDILAADPATDSVRNDWQNRSKVIRPQYSPALGRELGVDKQDIDNALEMNFSGSRAGLYREGADLLPVIVRPPEAERQDANHLNNVLVWSQSRQQYIPLSNVINGFALEWEDPLILRRDRTRVLTVQTDPSPLSGQTSGDILARVKPRIDALPLPHGYRIEWGGDAENSSEAQQGLFTTLPLGYLVMFIITVLMFSSLKNAVAIWLTVPLALIGVTPGFLLTGIPFGFMALIGLLSLSGMLIRNGIVLVEEIEQQKQEKDQRQAIIDAATSRLRPILLTAFTTVLGLAPLLRDVFFQSMAVVIMFGLAFATVLTLLVLPVIYACFHHKDMTPQR